MSTMPTLLEAVLKKSIAAKMRQDEALSIELKMVPERLDESLEEKRRKLRDSYQCEDGIVRTPDSCMDEVCDKIRRVAPCDVSVLLSGECGTGKELAARALHNNSLGHWLKIKKGRTLNYQIISPTTWNFSPRDRQEIPGAPEQALVDAPVREGETDPVSVQHIVRSFDPCIVCTVH